MRYQQPTIQELFWYFVLLVIVCAYFFHGCSCPATRDETSVTIKRDSIIVHQSEIVGVAELAAKPYPIFFSSPLRQFIIDSTDREYRDSTKKVIAKLSADLKHLQFRIQPPDTVLLYDGVVLITRPTIFIKPSIFDYIKIGSLGFAAATGLFLILIGIGKIKPI